MAKGNRRECLFSGIEFRPEDMNTQLAPESEKIICDTVLKFVQVDENFRRKLAEILVQDPNIVRSICTAVFATKCKSIGLLTHGSIADVLSKRIQKTKKQ